jgi:ribosomal protein L22
MRRNETRNISDLLRQFTRESPYSQKMMETKLINSWSTVLGAGIANATNNLRIDDRTLYVRIESPVMRHELFMMRTRIMEALNSCVGAKVITNIIFR